MESVAVSNVSGTGERFSHWEYKPTVWASYAGWVVVFDGFIPLIKVPTVLVTVPATYTTAPVLVPGPDIRTLRINLTIKDLVLPEDLTTETASFEVAFTGAQRLAVADGPADGEPFDSVVVADTISDDTVKRLKITIYPEYKAKKKTVLEATPKFSEFWTAFKASHEVPADSSTS